MLNNYISSLFVINKENKIDEIKTKTNLEVFFAYHYSGYFSVSKCMTKKVNYCRILLCRITNFKNN